MKMLENTKMRNSSSQMQSSMHFNMQFLLLRNIFIGFVHEI